MEMSDTTRNLDLLESANEGSGGCGCGGCGCHAEADGVAQQETVHAHAEPQKQEGATTTQTYSVIGMTCGHCAKAVTSELTALPGVSDVQVELVAGGTSTVTVRSDRLLAESEVVTALGEAGDYRLG